MTTLIVPALEEDPWPTLGPQVCAFIQQNLVFGPGDLRGRPAKLDADKRLLIYRAYEVYPQDHPQAGRRRFQRVVFSLRKGLAKTELAAWIAACELHPEGPVRCDGFREGQPIGRGVVDPYIPMVAYTEEQTEDLAYAALMTVLGEGPLASDFDIGQQRIMRVKGDGKAVALAAAPDARDGARTTFQHFDETHRFTLPRLKLAHKTMQANLPKRRMSDAWALETTTAYAIGENSVAEEAHIYARSVAEGEKSDTRLFYFHRQAAPDLDFEKPDELRRGIVEASGGDEEWHNVDVICSQFDDPTADHVLLDRLWGNRPAAGGGRAFPLEHWKTLEKHIDVPDGDMIALGFKGVRHSGAVALIATHLRTSHQWPIGIWEAPIQKQGAEEWRAPAQEIDAAVDGAFGRWDVWRMYGDPAGFESEFSAWQGRYGDKRVIEWRTYPGRTLPVARAVFAYVTAMQKNEISHSGNARFTAHIGHACKQETPHVDPDTNKPLHVIRKDREDSTFRIEAAQAGFISWECRNDAIAAGALEEQVAGVFLA